MRMTDEEIRREFEEAADQKKQVQILAEENGVGIWPMMEKLRALKVEGLDGRWYQNLNPARGGQDVKTESEKPELKPPTEKPKPASEKVEYLKKIIAEQAKQLTEAVTERDDLKRQFEEKDAELAETCDRLDAAETKLFKLADLINSKREDNERLSHALDEAREICETQIEAIRKKDAEIAELRKKQGINATSRLGLIRWFCRELTSPAAYLMGRLVEHLLDWRETGSAEELRKFLETMTEDENEN